MKEKRTLLITVLLSALAAILNLVAAVRNGNGIQALAALLFTVSAIKWWIKFREIKQQEEQDNE